MGAEPDSPGPAPRISLRPAPSAGSCALKGARAEPGCTCVALERNGAATGRAYSQALRAALGPPRLALEPYPDPHSARDPNPDPARPSPRPRPPGRWTTPTSIRTTRAWRPWRRPPTATSAPAASRAASNTAPCGPPSLQPGRPAPRSAPPTARLALYATTSPHPTRQVSPAPAQLSFQILQNPSPFLIRQVIATVLQTSTIPALAKPSSAPLDPQLPSKVELPWAELNLTLSSFPFLFLSATSCSRALRVKETNRRSSPRPSPPA